MPRQIDQATAADATACRNAPSPNAILTLAATPDQLLHQTELTRNRQSMQNPKHPQNSPKLQTEAEQQQLRLPMRLISRADAYFHALL
jgi:hypothetical protein